MRVLLGALAVGSAPPLPPLSLGADAAAPHRWVLRFLDIEGESESLYAPRRRCPFDLGRDEAHPYRFSLWG